MSYELLLGDCIAVMKTLPANSVQCAVTSPPYFGLRQYLGEGSPDAALEIGTEDTPEAYVERLVEVFREVRRVLRDDGTVWLNLGDSFWGGKGMNGSSKARRTAKERGYQQPEGTVMVDKKATDGKHPTIKPKDMIGIPWMVAFALRADGWYLRSDIVWAKKNCMPESVRDRPTRAHEYIFLLSKQRKYYYDYVAVQEDAAESSIARINQANFANQTGGPKGYRNGTNPNRSMRQAIENWAKNPGKRNRRSVWAVTTKPYKGAHFATYAPALIEPCILAGTSEHGCCAACGAPYKRTTEKEMPPLRKVTTNGPVGGHGLLGGNRFDEPIKTITTGWEPTCKCNADVVPCTVLDPFNGAATTGLVALQHGRDYIGIDLNDEYLELSRDRLNQVQPVLPEVG